MERGRPSITAAKRAADLQREAGLFSL